MAGRPRKAVGVSKGKIGKEKRLSRKIQEEKIRVDRFLLFMRITIADTRRRAWSCKKTE